MENNLQTFLQWMYDKIQWILVQRLEYFQYFWLPISNHPLMHEIIKHNDKFYYSLSKCMTKKNVQEKYLQSFVQRTHHYTL